MTRVANPKHRARERIRRATASMGEGTGHYACVCGNFRHWILADSIIDSTDEGRAGCSCASVSSHRLPYPEASRPRKVSISSCFHPRRSSRETWKSRRWQTACGFPSNKQPEENTIALVVSHSAVLTSSCNPLSNERSALPSPTRSPLRHHTLARPPTPSPTPTPPAPPPPPLHPMMRRVPPSLQTPAVISVSFMAEPARLAMDPRVLACEPFSDGEARGFHVGEGAGATLSNGRLSADTARL